MVRMVGKYNGCAGVLQWFSLLPVDFYRCCLKIYTKFILKSGCRLFFNLPVDIAGGIGYADI